MTILQINTVCGQGSTGRICTGIADALRDNGHKAYIAYGLGNCEYPDSIKINSDSKDYFLHNFLSRLTDSEGLHSVQSTRYLLRRIHDIEPDIIHLHTLHGHYINYKILLEYVHYNKIPLVMTLHDCWAFTGHCAHFDMFRCEKWQKHCHGCKYLFTYPQSYFIDRSSRNFELKRKLFTQLSDKLTVVPVSYWLEKLVRKSFLKEQKIITVHNGIDLSQFYPIDENSIREKYKIKNKYIVLGVALPWSQYKGLQDFYKLRSLLNENYAIILIGLSDKQKEQLPQGIIGVSPLNDVKILAEFYSAANVLVNTTYCDNYPTVNLEAMACGTAVITYNTGGSPEAITDNTGKIIDQGNITDLAEAIRVVCTEQKKYSRIYCVERAKKYFDKHKCFQKYIDIYDNIIRQ